MRADIHDGPEHMLQSEAGYIDARPLTPARQNLLQRTAGPYIWVKLRRTRREQMSSETPLKADIVQHSRHVSNVPTRHSCPAANTTVIRSPRRRAAAEIEARRDQAPLRS